MVKQLTEKFIKKIKAKVFDRDSKIIEKVKNLPVEDIADIIEELNDKQKIKLLLMLKSEDAKEVLNSLEVNRRFNLLKILPRNKALFLTAMSSPHELAEIGSYLEDEERKQFLQLIPARQRIKVKELLSYKKNSAGSIMTTEYLHIEKDELIKNVLLKVKKSKLTTGALQYLYVVDKNNKLVGIVSLRELISADPLNVISKIMNKDIIFARTNTDQEDVIRIMRKYNFLSLPVVDRKNNLLGIILYEDVFSAMEEEYSEDIARLAGLTGTTHGDEEIEMSIYTSIKRRLPWLTILLFLYVLTANVISSFSETIESMVFLAAFMPLIAAMAGNSATQSLALVIRGLTLREYNSGEAWKIVKKDAAVGVFLGFFNGIVISIIASIWQHNIYVGFIVGISLWAALSVSTLTGAVIPLIFSRAKIDPAVASGPFVTTINDIISLSIYFSIATFLISKVIN